jgi:hypothetical protein
MSYRNLHHVLFLSLALFALSLTGCSTGDTGATEVKAKPVEEQIKELQARTDMPEQAKNIAIQQLKNQSANAQAQAGNQAKGK